jgi:hypothetical protein
MHQDNECKCCSNANSVTGTIETSLVIRRITIGTSVLGYQKKGSQREEGER